MSIAFEFDSWFRQEEDYEAYRSLGEASSDEENPKCPKCGAPMVLRTARIGKSAGSQFYGCSRYPNCNGTMGYNPAASSRAPQQPQIPPGTAWIYSRALKSDPRFGEGESLAIAKGNGHWVFRRLSSPGSLGVLSDQEVRSGIIQSYRDESGKPMTSANPTEGELKQRLAQQAKQGKPAEKKSSPLIPDELMSDEQRAIDEEFGRMMSGDGPPHMMISALAGSGKTTILKHLAWKYGRPGDKWLYLVFNKKNQSEAVEKFPSFVDVRTTNGFLGEVLKDKSNFEKIPQTDRIASLANFSKEEGAGRLEKARLVLDGPQFSKLMVDLGIPENFDVSEYGKAGKTINSLMRSIRYSFKEQTLTLTNLAKSFALDPRNRDALREGLTKILDSYDFDTILESVKERIASYKGQYGVLVRQALNNIMKYDFMRKNYKDEILSATEWLLDTTMPHATDQQHRMGSMQHDLGQYRDFNDDLWYTSTFADQINWPKYKVVLADETQDFNANQEVMLNKLAQAGAKIVAVGDPQQCHPAGTKIAMTGGGCKNIEDVQAGDEVVTYNSLKSYFPGTNFQGRKILEVGKRFFSGQIVRITTETATQECTLNHRCLVRFDANGKYGLYLMVKGNQARIGFCRVNYQGGFGLTTRSVQGQADKSWLLAIFDNEIQARIAEDICSTKFKIPQVLFKNNGQKFPAQSTLDEIWRNIGSNLSNAKECLDFFGRDWEYPLWQKELQERFFRNKQNYIGSQKSFITQACNIISGCMMVRTFDGTNRGGSWETAKVQRVSMDGMVYSLSVEPTEGGKKLYVADNIVTHNSIYRFRGASADAFKNIGSMLSRASDGRDVTKTLSSNYRSRKAIIDFVNSETHVKNLKQGKKFDDGDGAVTKYEIKYDNVFDNLQRESQSGKMMPTAFISRTNDPLVHSALSLLTKGIPFVIIGKDIAKDLKNHIKKMSGRFQLREDDPANMLSEKMESFLQNEKEEYEGESRKKAYLQELEEVTNALISAIQQYEQEEENSNYRPHQGYGRNYQPSRSSIGGFNNWISKRLGGLDVEENERDLKEYRRKMEEENPVVLTTAHKSKGLEFPRVYILRYDQFPHKKAQRPEDLEQEANARYISLSRAQDELHILDLEGQPGYKKP